MPLFRALTVSPPNLAQWKKCMLSSPLFLLSRTRTCTHKGEEEIPLLFPLSSSSSPFSPPSFSLVRWIFLVLKIPLPLPLALSFQHAGGNSLLLLHFPLCCAISSPLLSSLLLPYSLSPSLSCTSTFARKGRRNRSRLSSLIFSHARASSSTPLLCLYGMSEFSSVAHKPHCYFSLSHSRAFASKHTVT